MICLYFVQYVLDENTTRVDSELRVEKFYGRLLYILNSFLGMMIEI